MKGNNFTYGSKVTFRYYLHPLQHQAIKMTLTARSFTIDTWSCHSVFSCMEGFLPQIPYEFQCLSSLTWSGTPHACHPVTCGGPPVVRNADYKLGTDTYQSVVAYTCREGYRYDYIPISCTYNHKFYYVCYVFRFNDHDSASSSLHIYYLIKRVVACREHQELLMYLCLN